MRRGPRSDARGQKSYMYVLVNCTSASSLAAAAGIDGPRRQRQCISQVFGSAGCDQGGGCVQQDHIPPCRPLSRENFPNDGGVSRGVAAGNIFEPGALDSEFFRRDLVGADVSVANFGDAGWSGNRDFIQAIQSVDHQSAMGAQHAERFRHFFHQVERIDADHLCRGLRRIGERAQQVEDCPQAELAAGGLHILHRRMHGRREQKHDADFFETSGQNCGGQADLDSQGLHDVGRAAFGAQTSVAVLGHAHACSGHHERGGGGNIESAVASPPVPQVSTSASRPVPLTARVDVVKRQRLGGRTHGLGEAHNFFHRLALHVQGDQQGGNLGVGGTSGENLGHHRARFFAGERFAWLAMRCRASVIMGLDIRLASRQGSAKPVSSKAGSRLRRFP